MALPQPPPITNGTDADATVVQAWFNYFLQQIAANVSLVPTLSADPLPTVNNFYFNNTTQTYRLYNYPEATWRDVPLNS